MEQRNTATSKLAQRVVDVLIVGAVRREQSWLRASAKEYGAMFCCLKQDAPIQRGLILPSLPAATPLEATPSTIGGFAARQVMSLTPSTQSAARCWAAAPLSTVR